MTTEAPSLMSIYEGWDSHQLALVRAITPLTLEQLAWRPAPHLSSVGELISHIALARLWWFQKMGAPGAGERVNTENPSELKRWADALEQQEAAIAGNPTELLRWLEASWQMIETTLTTWTVADLTQTYRHIYQEKMYVVSRQWTIWRIMS